MFELSRQFIVQTLILSFLFSIIQPSDHVSLVQSINTRGHLGVDFAWHFLYFINVVHVVSATRAWPRFGDPQAERCSVPFAQCERCMLTMSVDITQCARHMKSPGEPGGVYGATRLKQHSDVFSSSYRVLQSNISVDRNKYTERTPWWKKQALMKRHLALCSWLYRQPAILNLFKRARSKYIFQFVVSAEMKLKNE